MNTSQVVDVYPDLLGAEADAGLQRLVVDLASIYQGTDAPAALRKSLDAALLVEFGERSHVVSTRFGLPRFQLRAGALIAAAAIVVMVSVVGYAVAPLVDQLLATDRGASSLAMQNIGQSQTSNGVTVKLDRAYADVNRILVAYTIQVPAGFSNSTSGIDGTISLTHAQGRSFPLIDGQGVDGNMPHVSAGLSTFDAESLAPGTADVALRLSFPDVLAKAVKPGGSALAAGAFVFNFTVPVAPGHVVVVNKTLVANGIPVTLDRVVVTPSESRAYVRFPASAGIGETDWNANAHISGTGWDSRQLPAGFSGEMTVGSMFTNASGEHVTTFSGDFRSRRGQWVLTVDSLFALDTSAPSGSDRLPKQARVAGPWIFRFALS